jgi:hypothetical protein
METASTPQERLQRREADQKFLEAEARGVPGEVRDMQAPVALEMHQVPGDALLVPQAEYRVLLLRAVPVAPVQESGGLSRRSAQTRA